AFRGKMIMLASLLDTQSFPWPADWYHGRAQDHLGAELDDSYRLWFMDNADHVPPRDGAASTHVVRYLGELQQALLYLDDWVTAGTAPPASTSYEVDEDTQISVPADASERGGVQPVVELTVTDVDGREVRPTDSVEAEAGQPVTLTANAQLPPGTGDLVHAAAEIADARGELVATATASYRAVPFGTARHRIALTSPEADRLGQALSDTYVPDVPDAPGAPATVEETS
nr:hypothetical protein [Micromonospora sp. DSM 115978]